MQVLEQRDEIEYPESDGKPMAESGLHAEIMQTTTDTLRRFVIPAKDIYVTSNMLLYYEQGNNTKSISPDVLVLCDTHTEHRSSYQIWEEGRAPHIVIEITSKSTHAEDEGRKAGLYLEMGVKEYFQYDATQDYIKGHLKARRNVDGHWEPMLNYVGATMEDGVPMKIAFESKVLRIAFCVNNKKELRLWSTKDACLLQTSIEIDQGQDRALKLAESERVKKEAALNVARLEKKRADEEKQRADELAQQAKDEAQRADDAIRQADEATRREEAALQEILELKALLSKQ